MHNWRDYVRRHLPPLAVGPQRENAIVAELALQLEEACSEALACGASELDAVARAKSQFGDWDALAREINAAERLAEPAAESPRGGVLSGVVHDVPTRARRSIDLMR
jgi:hypothetical protein